uniref:Uncharacterized protein n=2 Tax=Latimeria chalumnae TaxID=7897 RepID=M3XK86_LATCH
MDKHMGEQLNKAYEAYRQACMERDEAQKELQQKTEFYEQKLHELREQYTAQTAFIARLLQVLLTFLGNSSGS